MSAPRQAPAVPLLPHGDAPRRRLRRVFLDGFLALDVAEPLASFDAERPAAEVRALLQARGQERVGVRVEGRVRGWAARAELRDGPLGAHLHPFGPDDLVPEGASLQEVIASLAVNERCFVTVLGEVAAVVTLQDLEKPPVRMFLFGMITVLEMSLTGLLESAFPQDGWTRVISPGRLAKARALQEERQRRGAPARLVDCLQFSDKGQLALKATGSKLEASLGMSRRGLERALKELEELRNNLAHGQQIIPQGWSRIAVFTSRLEQLLTGL
ncbi:MAG: hypothetical protein QM767_08890 [Anaeromyxobacter sp.]